MVSNPPLRDSQRTHRRRFLGALAAAAGSGTAAIAGARGSDCDSSPPRFERRAAGAEQRDSTDGEAEQVVRAVERHSVPLSVDECPVGVADLFPAASHLLDGRDHARAVRTRRSRGAATVAAVLSEHPVVGLGEATHGTHEFHAVRSRIVRELVAAHGCRAIAFEAQFSEVVAVNDYVVHGEGTAEAALAGISPWIWSTETVRDLFRWLRAFNRGRPRADRVEVHGIDGQYPVAPARALRAYAGSTDVPLLEGVEDVVGAIVATAGGNYFFEDGAISSERFGAVREVVDTVRQRLEERREQLLADGPERAWTLAVRHVRTLEQSLELYEAYLDPDSSAFEARDAAMAENATWLHEALDAGPVAVWAHNDHVRSGRVPPNDDRTAGWFLRDHYGDDYYATGFDFATGSFTALVGLEPPTLGTATFDEPEAPDSALLAEADGEAFFLDLDHARTDHRLDDWLAEPRELTSVGAQVHPEFRSDEYDLRTEFDGLVAVESTTPTTVVDHRFLPGE